MTRILIAEDEVRITTFLEKGLRAHGFSTEAVGDGTAALRRVRSGEFDLLLLDLGLPDMDGIDVLREIRRHGPELPVVILSARDSVRDTVTGLEVGADDYVTKPFQFDELLARVRARLRGEQPEEELGLLRAGDATLDLRTQQVLVGGQPRSLSATEFALAEVLFRNAGQLLTRDQLLDRVWGSDIGTGSNVVDVYVGYLRRKLGHDRITTVRGVGYRLETRLPRSSGPAL